MKLVAAFCARPAHKLPDVPTDKRTMDPGLWVSGPVKGAPGMIKPPKSVDYFILLRFVAACWCPLLWEALFAASDAAAAAAAASAVVLRVMNKFAQFVK